MSQEMDSHVHTRVMGVLNRNWIDLDATSMVCVMGEVLVKGELRRKGPRGRDLAAPSIEELEKELSQTRGVRRVDLNLENWVRTSEGRWRPKKAG